MEEETLTMREVSRELEIPVHTIRYFCNHGLVPHVRRSLGRHRVFSAEQCAWISTLNTLRESGMGLQELKTYARLCRKGAATIRERKAMLTTQKRQMRQQVEQLERGIDFIERREELFDAMLEGKETQTDQWL